MMAGAGCVSDKDFGGRGINVADQGGGSHIKVSGAGIYNGGVGDLVGRFGWRRGGTAARISRRNKFTIRNFIFTCYAGVPTASLNEVVPALVAVSARA